MRRTAALGLWVGAVVLGFALLARYGSTAGEPAATTPRWPEATRLARAAEGRATLVLFAHPHCPCTVATMDELAVVMARAPARVEARVVFVRPPGVASGWERADLWERAARIPGVDVRTDEGGVEARRFGAKTSGQVLLYDPDGALHFAGGITGSRGMAGDNAGRAAVEAALAGRAGGLAKGPVFGCPLLAPERCGEEETCPR